MEMTVTKKVLVRNKNKSVELVEDGDWKRQKN